ncbi:hypothetical protein ACP4OV_012665 [Aristida adscensionis]
MEEPNLQKSSTPPLPFHKALVYESPPVSTKAQLKSAPNMFASSSSNFTPVSSRMLSSIGTIDLNTHGIDGEYTTSPIQKKRVSVGRFAESHWVMDTDHPERDRSTTHILFDWLSTTNSEELQRTWIMHESPRFIEIQGQHLKDVVARGGLLNFDIFDIAIRRIKQLDSLIYPTEIPLHWRHFLESILRHALSTTDPAECVSIRHQFIGPDVNYEISRCHICAC